MDFKNFKDETFSSLPSIIIGSNFDNCIFNAVARFEKCNISNSTFIDGEYFYLSNITDCVNTENCTFDKSNNIHTEEELKKEIIEE